MHRAPHELDAVKQKRDKEAAERKQRAKAKARAEAKAATESSMIPFEAAGPSTKQSTGDSTRMTKEVSMTGSMVSSFAPGASVSAHGDATTPGSSIQGTGGLENLDGGSKGGVSSLESNSFPTFVSSITTATEDLPANVIASG